jgi:deoxyhypusine synthase
MDDRLLAKKIRHIGFEDFDPTDLIESFSCMSFQARNVARASQIYVDMLRDRNCTVILCLAGSLFSAGLKKIVAEMVSHKMVDAIVSTGAIVVDQDFFEGLGFSHYAGSPHADDENLRKRGVDRIYDTYISEDDLRVCDMTVSEIADSMEPGTYSSREFIIEMGRYLKKKKPRASSVVLEAHKNEVPIFVPAFSDCSAGFGLVHHQSRRQGKPAIAIDSVKDFLELTKIKMASKDSGLFIVGGGAPKNFAQDTPVAADILGERTKMHKYAIQITVADERDGALSSSTLREAHSWGKVGSGREQMVYSEATLALPLVAAYAYHAGAWKGRKPKRFNRLFEEKNDT